MPTAPLYDSTHQYLTTHLSEALVSQIETLALLVVGLAAFGEGARQMGLHRQVIIGEKQIGKERSFGEDGEYHRPPAAGAGIDSADGQAALQGVPLSHDATPR